VLRLSLTLMIVPRASGPDTLPGKDPALIRRCFIRPRRGRGPALVALAAVWAAGPARARAQETPPPDSASPLSYPSDDLRVDLGGYGSVRWEASDAGEVPSSFTLRRFVVTTDARLGSRFRVYSEVEYERLQEIEIERSASPGQDGVTFGQEIEGQNGGAIELEQAWGEYRVADGLGLRFGVVLPPVGRFNLRHDDNLWNFPERPLVDRAVNVLPAAAAWREMGLGAVGRTRVGRTGELSYEAYLVNGVQLDFSLDQKIEAEPGGGANLVTEAEVAPRGGAFDGSNPADAVTARVALSPALGSEIAVSGYVGRYTPGFVARSQTLRTVGVDGRQKLGPAYVEGEFLYSRYGGLERAIEDFAAAVVNHSVETGGAPGDLTSEAEVELSGLSRSRYGFWLDLGLPVALPRGALGLDDAVVTPIARYERVWLHDNLEEMDFAGGVVTGSEFSDRQQGRLWLGVAFRPVPQAVVQLAYRRDDAIDGPLSAPAVSEDAVNSVLLGMAFGF